MANPVFNIVESQAARETVIDNQVMTVNGTIQATACLLILTVLAAAFVWSRFTLGYTDMVSMLTFGGLILGFILSLIIIFARNTFLVPVYAVCEGCALGGVSALMESAYPGIVYQAVLGTFAAMISMLILYRAGVIKCSDKFRSIIFISTLSIAGIYLIDLVGRFFGYAVPLINTTSGFGIGFSILVVVIAALNLIIDFDNIERGVQHFIPKKYEWLYAFGLLVTLVWLYIEILNLLSKMRSRN